MCSAWLIRRFPARNSRCRGASFDPDAFGHVALRDAGEEWIEMRLWSLQDQVVTVPRIDLVVESAEG